MASGNILQYVLGRRSASGLAIVVLLGACLYGHATDQSCADISKQIQALDLQKEQAGNCPLPGPTSTKPVGPAIPGQVAKNSSCVPDTQAELAFQAAHQTQYNALFGELKAAGCSPQCAALPPVKPILSCRPGIAGRPPLCMPEPDLDGDGIPDSLETALIERFSPYLRFTVPNPSQDSADTSDPYRPMDPIVYVQHAQLVEHNNGGHVLIPSAQLSANPGLILQSTQLSGVPSNILAADAANSCLTGTPRTQPYAVQGLDDGAEHGAAWDAVMAAGNVGMFAHVTRFVADSPSDLPSLDPVRRLIVGTSTPVIPLSRYEDPSFAHNCKAAAEICYRIEYYQFFGKNEDFAPFSIGDHQADLSILTVIYNASLNELLAVSHWAHGYEMRFDLMAGGGYPNCPQNADPLIGQQMTCSGANASQKNFNILKIVGISAKQDQPEKAQNNVVSFWRDPTSGQYSHPVVFVEVGSHEFWPTQDWGAQGAPAHWGDDKAHHYVAHNIPNLGEIEHPMGSAAAILTGYNGYWGNKNVSNDVSPGPILHASWYWFMPDRPMIDPRSVER